jgi:hypothetical protein
MWIDARQRGYHSGNWGGLLSDPAIQLAHAIASIVQPTGKIRVPEWLPKDIPANVRRIFVDCELESGAEGPEIEPDWGEPGLTSAEKVFGWSSFTVLAFEAGTPKRPVNAIAPRAWARCQLRFVVGVDEQDILPALCRHLDRNGFSMVQIAKSGGEIFHATRLDPDHPWVQWAVNSITRTTGKNPAILPNLGASLPNDVFSEILKLPTVWCRTPIRRVRNTPRTSIYRSRSSARASRLWLAFTGTLMNQECQGLVLEAMSECHVAYWRVASVMTASSDGSDRGMSRRADRVEAIGSPVPLKYA